MSNSDKRPATDAQTGDRITDSADRILPAAAQRALAEAQERRRLAEAQRDARAREMGGRKGPEPTRYGDWEKDGIVSDF